MKRFVLFWMVGLLFLSGCTKTEPSVQRLFFGFETLGNFSILREDALRGEAVGEKTRLFRISSLQELEQFEEMASAVTGEDHYRENGLLQNSSGIYYKELDGFFEEKELLLVHQWTPTGMAACWIEGVEKEGDVVRILLEVGIPQPCTDDTGEFLLGVEVDKADLHGCSVTVVQTEQLIAVK